MTTVYAWPPFELTGWDIGEHFPRSRSVGTIDGRPRESSAKRERRFATANVTGIGSELSGSGYVRMLNRFWGHQPRLTRIEARSALWHMSSRLMSLQSNMLEWTTNGVDLLWTSDGTELLWGDGQYTLSGEPGSDGIWNSVLVTGLPPSSVVARPSELISVTNGAGVKQEAYVVNVTRSDALGTALVRTDSSEAFSISGLVSIGHAESIVFEAVDVPRSVQNASGTFGFQWRFKEVYEDESSDGWTEVNPWV